MKLLTRDEFREAVFARDGNKCVVCGNPAQDAHHILERRLFEDGGYYLNNGASLCGPCHIKAEETTLSAEHIREAANIDKIVLPPHLYPDYDYDKWGNIQNPNRTYHLPFSYGRTEDDRVIPNCSQFEGKEVVVTVKMDGENTTGYSDGYIHARSLDSQNHPSRNWVKNFLSNKLFELPEDWRICGENLFAKHSIHYKSLASYFYVFSIWENKNFCLSWDETVEWCKMLDLQIVPTLYRGIWNEQIIKNLYTPTMNGEECEGFVVRLTDTFPYGNFRKSVAKFVRESHVRTNQHWIKTAIIKNELK